MRKLARRLPGNVGRGSLIGIAAVVSLLAACANPIDVAASGARATASDRSQSWICPGYYSVTLEVVSGGPAPSSAELLCVAMPDGSTPCNFTAAPLWSETVDAADCDRDCGYCTAIIHAHDRKSLAPVVLSAYLISEE